MYRPDQEIFNKETKFKIQVEKDEVFMKILGAVDFTECKSDLDAVRVFWHNVWPAFSKVISDNEILLEEQRVTLRNFGSLMEEHKLLEIEYHNLKEIAQALGHKFDEKADS